MSTDPVSPKKSRPRRSKSEVLSLLEDYKKSGLTQAAFAKSRDLPLGTLTNWLRRMRANGMRGIGDSSRPDFLEAQVVGPLRADAETLSHDFELMLGVQGNRKPIVKSVRLRGGFDSGDLSRVLDVLGAEGASNQE